MKLLIVFISVFLSSFYSVQNKNGIDRNEAVLMFNYLQELRQKEVPTDDPLLKYVADDSEVLVWNDTLAAVAEARVEDLVNKNYFDHIDKKGRGVNYYIDAAGYSLEPEWTEQKDYNFFESLEAGKESYKEIIADLIIDKGIPGKGHRKHLLGLDDWNKKNVDVGIAFYRVGDGMKTEYTTYTVIIIARHRW